MIRIARETYEIWYEGNTMLGIVLLILLALILFFLIVMIIDCHRFIVKEYTCVSDKLKKDGRFVLLSDLHNKSFGEHNDKLLQAIDRLKPDMIVIAGDMYTSKEKTDTREVSEFVCRLARKYPIYYGNGNHEHKTKLYPEVFGSMYEKFVKEIKQEKVELLENEKITLPQYNIDIYGLEIERKYYGKFVTPPMEKGYLDELLGKPETDKFTLLIAHNPDYFKAYAAWGADLVVSGHVHGGLMKLPVLGGVISPKLRLFPKYDGGEFKEGKSTMILGRGLGTHTLPIRIFNPGELVVVNLCNKVD